MRTVTVVGHGRATAVPDTAVVRVGASHAAPGLAEALAGAASAGEQVVAVARRHLGAGGVSSQDLSVWPHHDHEGRPAGFRARHAYVLRCPDLDLAGMLVTELAAQVGDRLEVDGVSLAVADTTAVATRARTAAYDDARERATHLASLAGAVLGDVQSVVEGGSGAGAGPGGGTAAYSAKLDLSFEPGEQAVVEALTVTWALV